MIKLVISFSLRVIVFSNIIIGSLPYFLYVTVTFLTPLLVLMYYKSVTIIVDLFDSLYCIIIKKRNCLHMCSLKLKKVFIQIFFVGWWKWSNLCLVTLLINFVILDIVENRLDYTGSSWIQRLRLFKTFERNSFGISTNVVQPPY